MRVVKVSPDLLILEDRPFFWGLLLSVMVLVGVGVFLAGLFAGQIVPVVWGGGFAGLALFLLLAAIRRTRLFLDRRTDLAEIRTQGARRTSSQTFRLRDLEAAELQGSGKTFRVALRFTGHAGAVPTRRAYQSGASSQLAVDTINTWLKGQT